MVGTVYEQYGIQPSESTGYSTCYSEESVQCRQTSSRKFAKSAPIQYFTRTKNFFAYVAAYNSVAKNDGSFKKLSHEETQLSIHLSRSFFSGLACHLFLQKFALLYFSSII
jgi:hypothetical protein